LDTWTNLPGNEEVCGSIKNKLNKKLNKNYTAGRIGNASFGVNSMTSVETELWNIFTYYTLRGDSLDPEHLKTQQFMQFLRDCLIVEPRWTTKHAAGGGSILMNERLATSWQ
jgi:hypothetical protein